MRTLQECGELCGKHVADKHDPGTVVRNRSSSLFRTLLDIVDDVEADTGRQIKCIHGALDTGVDGVWGGDRRRPRNWRRVAQALGD